MKLTSQKGFTLIELIVVIAITAIIGVIVMNVFISSNRVYMTQSRVIDIQSDLKICMRWTELRLRQAGLDPLGTIPETIILATPTSTVFVSDGNKNGVLEDNEWFGLDYDAINTTFLRVANASTASEQRVPLSGNITAFQLQYLDSALNDLGTPGTDLALLSQIQFIRVNFTAQERNFQSNGISQRSLSTMIRCRNL